MLPEAFRGRRALPVANAVALGATLATLTGAVAYYTLPSATETAPFVPAVAIPTLLVGAFWSYLLHLKTTVTRRRIRLGWVLSVPLAALNAALSCGALMAFTESRAGQHVPGAWVGYGMMGAFAGATFGAIIWIPALIATLVLFGLPVRRAQRMAARGLAGEEQGERFVGLACALLAVIGSGAVAARPGAGGLAAGLLLALGALGALSGGAAAWMAQSRAARRTRFVTEAEAGRVQGYRVDVIPEGKVLIRVATHGEAYRQGEQFEAVFELARDGAAKRALASSG